MNFPFDFKRFPIIVGAAYKFRANNYRMEDEFFKKMRGVLQSCDKASENITIKIDPQPFAVDIPLIWDGNFNQFANQWELC